MGKPHFQGIVDKNCNLPVGCSCIQLLKSSLDEVNPRCSLGVLPVLFDNPSFPVKFKCPFHNLHGQGVYDIPMFPEEGMIHSQCQPHLAFLGLLGVPNPVKGQMRLDDQLKCQNYIDLQMENGDAYSQCSVDIDIVQGDLETPKSSDATVGSLKNEGALTLLGRALRRQISLQIGGKFMQLLINQSLMFLKLTSRDKLLTERVHETPSNRWRKYKRAASFDSRKVVLLFSILSSMGTTVLIYLTLRVRIKQLSDGVVLI